MRLVSNKTGCELLLLPSLRHGAFPQQPPASDRPHTPCSVQGSVPRSDLFLKDIMREESVFKKANSKLIQRPPEALMWVLQVPSVAEHLAAVHVSSRWTVLNVLNWTDKGWPRRLHTFFSLHTYSYKEVGLSRHSLVHSRGDCDGAHKDVLTQTRRWLQCLIL